MGPGTVVKSYGTTQLPKPGNKLWSTSDYEVALSLSLIVFTLTASSYYYYALLPAWEADAPIGVDEEINTGCELGHHTL